MSYTLDLTFVISIGIIEFFQLVSIWHIFFVYSYVFALCMYVCTSYSINFNWYL